MTSSSVVLHPGSIWINGQPLVIVTSSLFYFRIPAAEWRGRMRTLRLLGYNAIDAYFPWNYHELEPDRWDFSGMRDVRAFLQQAKEEGLWVVARPGPYICSEWDGGSLPAWLNVDPDMRLRDNSPHYLEAVRRWYDQIMPMLAEYQVERGGTVVLVQIENELDFYSCADRSGLMTTLRDIALAHEITVPLLACAGQGDILGATGNTAGVVPTCNIYFDRDPMVEERVRHYDDLMRQRGYPLFVIETNRSHTDLRRLMAGGAKLLGPYLQTGGTDFGFTTGVTNWGDPLSFMTTHYDFGGMVSPGGKVRPEGCEAIILTKMLTALGSAMALSAPRSCPPVPVRGVDGQALALDGGGWLVGLPNTGDKVVQVTLGETAEHFPVKTGLKVAPNTCPFVLLDYPLSRWGIDCRITYSTVELVDCMARDDALVLTFATDSAAELMVDWPDSILGDYQSWQIEKSQTGWRLWTDSSASADIELIGGDGKRLIVKAVDRVEIGNLGLAGLDEQQIVSTRTASQEFDLSLVNCRLAPLDPCGPEWFAAAPPCKPGKLHLEENNIFRGFGWYRTTFTCRNDVQGFLVQSGSDVLSLYLGARFLGTLVPGGGDAYVPLQEDIHFSTEKVLLVVRAEIWGHANFDDHRLPALRLKSMRGMGGLVAVRETENITSNWFYQHGAQVPTQRIDLVWPYMNFGGWSTTEEPLRGVYYREVSFVDGMDARVLHFPGLQANAQVFLNGYSAGMVNPFNPFVDLGNLSRSGETARIAVVVEQDFRCPIGQVLLYQGESYREWELAGWNEAGLADLAQKPNLAGTAVNFPITLASGEMAWLHVDLPLSVDWNRGWDLQLTGRGLKVSAWIGKHLIGRIWLPSEIRPRMTGGADDRMVLPADWLEEANGQLHFLLEGVNPIGELQNVKFIVDG